MKPYRYIFGLFFAIIILLAGCGGSEPGDAELAASDVMPDVSAERKQCRVEFYAMGQCLISLTMEEWSTPQVPAAPEVEGAEFLCWLDKEGREISPESSPLRGDTVYTAKYLPLLSEPVPYLFADENGLLHPDRVLEYGELRSALYSLADSAAEALFPVLPETGGEVDGAMLRGILSHFFSAAELDKAINCPEGSRVSRSQFAAIMNSLLERGGEEGVIAAVGDGALSFPDVQPERDDFACLMEAAIPHRHGEGGSDWAKLGLTSGYDEGLQLIDGCLYYADSRGYYIYDTILGQLTFGYDSCYTSGDPLLDSYVRVILADIASEHPGAEPIDLLRAAYDHCRDSFGFLRSNSYGLGEQGWQIPNAISIFETGQGNSYNFAAAFWALARGMGYEASAVSGSIGEERASHAWVEITLEDTLYIFDPFMEFKFKENGETVRDMFMVHPDVAANWRYYRGE